LATLKTDNQDPSNTADKTTQTVSSRNILSALFLDNLTVLGYYSSFLLSNIR